MALGGSFGNILKFGFELKNMVCHIFWPKGAKQSDPRKEAAGARARNAVEDLNVQVIRSYSWAAAESPKKLAV